MGVTIGLLGERGLALQAPSLNLLLVRIRKARCKMKRTVTTLVRDQVIGITAFALTVMESPYSAALVGLLPLHQN